jgi:hypothetical protein
MSIVAAPRSLPGFPLKQVAAKISRVAVAWQELAAEKSLYAAIRGKYEANE